MSGADAVRRFGMVVNVHPERREDYLRLHREVWPGVEAAMRDNGMRNFSIWIIENTLFGYYEWVGDDYEAGQARIKADELSQQWWALTDPCQTPFGDAPDGVIWREMELAWHMD